MQSTLGHLDKKWYRSAKCCYYSSVFNYMNNKVLCLLSGFLNKVKPKNPTHLFNLKR